MWYLFKTISNSTQHYCLRCVTFCNTITLVSARVVATSSLAGALARGDDGIFDRYPVPR